MPIARKFHTVSSHGGRHGVLAALRLVIGQPLEAIGALQLAVCYRLPDAVGALTPGHVIPGLEVRQLSAAEVHEFVRRGEEWFFPQAVEASLDRGDLCFGGYLGGVLACNGWYATRPLPLFGRILSFPSDSVWEHRLFTKPEYRGLGLNAALKLPVAQYFAGLGRTVLVNTVLWTNSASRRLHERMGYARCGTLVRIGGNRIGVSWLSGGREGGLRLSRPPAEG